MSRYFLLLSYNGAPFHGWQTQPNAVTVQQTIEQALAKLLRRPVPILGSGRTDAGVHARVMYAHFDLPELDLSQAETKGKLILSLNSLCGPYIAIHDILPVPDDAHARFDATSRTYHYYVNHRKSPFMRDFSLYTHHLDYQQMNRAAELLLHTDDFTSFAKLHSDAKTNICRVTQAEWQPLGDDRHMFVITADRFLRNMVRAVVGTLVEVGRGKLTLDQFAEIVATRNRCEAGTSMPPYPLFLWNVTYPYTPPIPENFTTF